MTLIVKFKNGTIKTYEDIDDVDYDESDRYLYVWTCNGRTLRCKSCNLIYYIQRYSTGQEYVTRFDGKGKCY